MKRIYIALAMLIISGVICGLEMYEVRKNAESYISGLDEVKALTAESNYTDARILSEELLKSWKESSKKFDIYLYHDYIDNITENMSLLPVYADNENNEAALGVVENIKIQLTSLIESELPYIHNIL